MWTHENRPKYNRDHLRYPSDLTDDEWALVKPFIPPPKPGGGKRSTDMRAVMNGVMYINQSISNPTFTRRIEEKASERRSGFSPEFFASCAWTKRPCFWSRACWVLQCAPW